MLTKREVKKQLGVTADRDLIQKILAVGHEFDVDKGGYFDARMGCVNLWCGPEDKPECWPEPTQGGLNYPRDYVGGVSWDFNDDGKAELYIEVTPFTLAELNESRTERMFGSPRWDRVTDEHWDQCVEWCEKQAKTLLRFARIHATSLGVSCPFCDYVLENGRLLNELFEHLTEHGEVGDVVLGDGVSVTVNGQSYTLQEKTDID